MIQNTDNRQNTRDYNMWEVQIKFNNQNIIIIKELMEWLIKICMEAHIRKVIISS